MFARLKYRISNIFGRNNNTYKRAIKDTHYDTFVKQQIIEGIVPFIQCVPVLNPKMYAGWKITIVGNSVDDALYLYDNLGKYLYDIHQPFKIGTKKLIRSKNKEQSHKLLTIYVMKLNDVEMLYDDICIFLRKYACGYKLKYSTHVVGPIWKRIDRDKDGNYIPANPNERKNIKMQKQS